MRRRHQAQIRSRPPPNRPHRRPRRTPSQDRTAGQEPTAGQERSTNQKPPPAKSPPAKAAKKAPAKAAKKAPAAAAKKAPPKKAAKKAGAKKAPPKQGPATAKLADTNGDLTSAAKEAAAKAKSTVASAPNPVAGPTSVPLIGPEPSRLPLVAAIAAGVLAILVVLFAARRGSDG